MPRLPIPTCRSSASFGRCSSIAGRGARSPKLFDVLGAWVLALAADVASAITGNGGALALALNASVADVTVLATALGATAPTLVAATQPGSLADVGVLAALASALDAIAHDRIGAAMLVQLAVTPPTPDSAAAAMGVFQSQYTQTAWFGAVQPVEDTLRQARRDALVAMMIGTGPAVATGTPLLTTDDLFDYYLIDPEMCACGLSTRLLEASLAVPSMPCRITTLSCRVSTSAAAAREAGRSVRRSPGSACARRSTDRPADSRRAPPRPVQDLAAARRGALWRGPGCRDGCRWRVGRSGGCGEIARQDVQ